MSNPSTSYRNYVLAMLTLVYVFNFIDRQLLVILQEAIKKDLGLSDTQLGLLSGFTFAIFYVTVGIPIARLADKRSRRNIVALSLGLWSIMTALSGLARNFAQLLLARIGVGVGEAGGSPPAHAMISDYFKPEHRATALAIYSTGIYFGMMFGFVMGGYLNESLGWRVAFFVLGIPGVLFSLLFYLTVKEPQRGATDVNAPAVQQDHSLNDVLKLLFSKKTFIFLGLATGLHAFCIYGVFNWAPSFLARLHGMTNSQIGVSLGFILGIGGAIGSFAGGYLADRLGKKDRRWYLKMPAYAISISIPFVIGALFIPNHIASQICFGVASSIYSMYLGPSIAVAHQLVPASMRALTSAILFLILNLIGLGFGPLTVGIVSDALTPSLGVEALRWAMAGLVIVSTTAVTLFFVAARNINTDVYSQH
ncbi:MAG TPA: MFS transporter [Cyclobacteriaceae bacterium]|nr:MFS transporter [Cyclobacteriaceae bacterium]